ncbi:hypothetical protein BURKHO8Y_180051 [Burkholderia sp. 8Y]|nr:hypothetical protein BURKHO8Y_180051 [Burkholderia sp. 8Y]
MVILPSRISASSSATSPFAEAALSGLSGAGAHCGSLAAAQTLKDSVQKPAMSASFETRTLFIAIFPRRQRWDSHGIMARRGD